MEQCRNGRLDTSYSVQNIWNNIKPGHRVFKEGEENVYLTKFKIYLMWNFDFIEHILADPFAISFCSKHELVET